MLKMLSLALGTSLIAVNPAYASISDFSYPGARPLYIYVKAAHLPSIKGLKEFVGEFAKVWGPDGALKKQGMVVAPEDVRAANAKVAAEMTLMDPAGLK